MKIDMSELTIECKFIKWINKMKLFFGVSSQNMSRTSFSTRDYGWWKDYYLT